MRIVALGILIALWLGRPAVWGEQPTITIEAGDPGVRISPRLYGIFFEETNHAGDGGLYAELVRNRSFEDNRPPEGMILKDGKAVAESGFTLKWRDKGPLPGWTLVQERGKGSLALDTAKPLNAANRQAACLKIERIEGKGGRVGLANGGYWGIPLTQGAKYELSFYARGDRIFKGPLSVTLEQGGGKALARASFGNLGAEWKRYACTLQSEGDAKDARLVLSAGAPGTLWLDMVSLFPQKTFHNRPNGLRPDLAGMLADLRPGFLRFPGGCFLEGVVIENALRWKRTIGDVAGRPGRWSPAGYRTTEGLGYHEYLQLCEDLKAEPLLVVNCGMSCQLFSAGQAPPERMGEWVQDALDAIEYANGPASGKWGALRAQNGHAKPFGLKFVEIGNENSGPDYEARYRQFHRAIKAKYPDLKLVAGSSVAGAASDLRDDHYYSTPEWFRANAHLYDEQKRDGTKVFVGEYASMIGVGLGNLKGALAEAAFMIGLERNADLVEMACYAPLFVNVRYRSWNPDLIGFDNTACYGTPSYYVQKLFAQARGDAALPTRVTCEATPFEAPLPSGGIGLGTCGTQVEFKDVRISRGDQLLYASDFTRGAEGWQPARSAWAVRGAWSVKDGAYRQSARSVFENRAYSYFGDPAWTDYTLKLKARKLGGTEGFLILFRARDAGNQMALNLGGWGNTAHGIEKRVNWAGVNVVGGRVKAEPIQTGRWYDIEVRVKGQAVTCLLDGRQILHVRDFSQTGQTMPLIEAIAHRIEPRGEVALKVVNFAETAQPMRIKLNGVTEAATAGEATVLTSGAMADENTLDEPKKVAPVVQRATGLGQEFVYTFQPHSLTVLRFKAK